MRSTTLRTLSCFLIVIAGPFLAHPAFAWNRDSQQHITEYAYAYLKAYSICKNPSITGNDCSVYDHAYDTCAQTMPDTSAGYQCGCADEYCGATCEHFEGVLKENCITNCIEYGKQSEQVKSCIAHENCQEPYYWDPNDKDAITAAVCAPKVYKQTHIVWSEDCEKLGAMFDALGISPDDAKSAVEFYQGFQSTACPLKGYNYKSEPDCDYTIPQDHTHPDRNLRDPSDAQALLSWRDAPFANHLVGPDVDESTKYKSYHPMSGPLFEVTNWSDSGSDNTTIDFSGTILGFHTGVLDKFHDVWLRWEILPVVDDFITTGAEVLAGAGGGAAALLVAAGGVLWCAVSCPITVFFGTCDDCFSGTFDTASDILSATNDEINKIEESHIVPAVYETNEFAGNNLSSNFHFIDYVIDGAPRHIHFDDKNGWAMTNALGTFSVAGAAFLSGVSTAFEFQVDYHKSKTSLNNYSVAASGTSTSDDGMADSVPRSVTYWERAGIQNYVFPPVDNLAYYWWHKWFEGRLNGKAEIQYGTGEYGLMPLGAVLHAVQDASQPFHSWGLSLKGHLPYEDDVSNNFDLILAKLRPIKHPDPLINPNTLAGERRLLTNVSGQLFLIYEGGIGETTVGCSSPCFKPLRARPLIHYLAQNSSQADWDIDWFNDLFSPWGRGIGRTYTRDVALPRAIAASIAVLYEASKDPQIYASAMDLDLASFEHEGPVPAASQQMSYQDIPDNLDSVDPTWSCATSTERGANAIQAYFNNEMSGEELLQVAFAEKTRCEIQAAGLPVPPDSELDQIGQNRAQVLRISTSWLQDGDTARADGELACLYAQWTDELPVGERNRYQERCDGLLDSDGDGVMDQDDSCNTDQSLLDKGYTVKSNGCVFDHPTASLPPVNPFDPGSIRRINP